MATSFESLTINLEHDIDEQYQYQPGEVIRGKVAVHLHRTTLIQTIAITMSGEGVVSWDDYHEGSIQGSEMYLNASKQIFDVKDTPDQKPMSLDQGFHDFPFEYKLPENIPSSFIGKYGSITYILKAMIQGVKNGDTNIASEPFLVLRDLVLPESAFQPVERFQKQRYWATCSWGNVKVKLRLNKTGFLPGEDMFLHAEVQNRSPVRVTAIQAAIVMKTVYHVQKKYIEFRQIVNKSRDEYELSEGDGRRWQGVRISVPPYIPESFLDQCDIIDLAYFFQFRVELSGGNEMKVEVPILVGAQQKEIEISSEETNNVNANNHWTPGDRSSSMKADYDMSSRHNDWHGGAPEFRSETLVANPLFRNESSRSGKHDSDDHGHRGSRL